MTEQKAKWGNTMPQKGDWVYEQNTNRPIFTIHVSAFDPNAFQPIPLTPEVMERIEKPSANWWYDGDAGDGLDVYSFIRKNDMLEIRLVYLVDDSSFLWVNGKEFCRNPMIHHLQQLYRLLTGNELTIDWT